jgi:hypothetical protein
MSGEFKLNFCVSCGTSGRGIYLREAYELQKPQDIAVTVEPKFTEEQTGTELGKKNGRFHSNVKNDHHFE